MCLAIPARLVDYVDDERIYGTVELGGVRRRINTCLLVGEDAAEAGDYVLVHVGFALSRVSEEEARETLRILDSMGPSYADELKQIRESLELDPIEDVGAAQGGERAHDSGEARALQPVEGLP